MGNNLPQASMRFNEVSDTDPNVADAREEYGTPWSVFNPLHAEFQFELDVCAKDWNAKLPRYLSPQQNGLMSKWGVKTAWCKPPYGSENVVYWLQKAIDERENGTTTVMLLPSTTDVRWYHQYIYDSSRHTFRPGISVRFVEKRIKFIVPKPILEDLRRKGKKESGTHTGSILVIVSPLKAIFSGICVSCNRPL